MFALQLYTLVCSPGVNFSCGEKPGTVRVIIVPDTQTYTEKYPEIFRAQMDWGFLRIVTLQPGRNTMRVQTFSPWLKAFKSGPQHQFVLRKLI